MKNADLFLSFVFGKWEFEDKIIYILLLLLLMIIGYAIVMLSSFLKNRENDRIPGLLTRGLKLSVYVLTAILSTGIVSILIGGGLLFVLGKVFHLTYSGDQRFSLLLIIWGVTYLVTITWMFLKVFRKKIP